MHTYNGPMSGSWENTKFCYSRVYSDMPGAVFYFLLSLGVMLSYTLSWIYLRFWETTNIGGDFSRKKYLKTAETLFRIWLQPCQWNDSTSQVWWYWMVLLWLLGLMVMMVQLRSHTKCFLENITAMLFIILYVWYIYMGKWYVNFYTSEFLEIPPTRLVRYKFS